MHRGRALTCAIVTGAVALAGCGSGDSSGGDPGTANLSVLDRAASATAKQQSFHITSDSVQTLAGRRLTIRSEGDASGTRSHLRFDFAPLVRSLGGTAALGGALDRVGGTDALKADLVSDGTTVLLKMPALQRGLKVFAKRDVPPWASIDVVKFGRLAGVDFGSLLAGSTGADQALGYLRALTGSLKTVGSERIDGVQTTHYRGTIDFANVPKGAVKPAQAQAMAQVAKLLKSAGSSTRVPVDVWVGSDDLVRREVITQDISGTKSVTTLNLSDYGKAVDITLPPQSERFDALALVEELAPGALASVGKQLGGGAGAATPAAP